MAKKISMLLVLVTPLLLFTLQTMAGGVSWLFQVQDFHEVKGGEAVIVLKPLEGGKEFPLDCSTLTVHAKYDWWRWLFFGSKDMTKANHKKALWLLKEAFDTKHPVRFGSMGQGFGFQGGRPSSCTVYCRGLVMYVEGDGKTGKGGGRLAPPATYCRAWPLLAKRASKPV